MDPIENKHPIGILCIGEALIDVVRNPDGTEQEHPGGSPLNVAIGLGRLGQDVTFLTSIGKDQRGDLIRDHLERSRVTVSAASTEPETTSTAIATITPHGAARYFFDIWWELEPSNEATSARVIHTGSLAAAIEPGCTEVLRVITDAREHALITFDPNIRPEVTPNHAAQLALAEKFFEQADIVKLSDEDGAWLYPGLEPPTIAKHILTLGPSVVAITYGPNGAEVWNNNTNITTSAADANVVDTIGAGDSFMAGLIHQLANYLAEGGQLEEIRRSTWPSRQMLEDLGRFASACSAHTIRQHGANLPWLAQLP